MTSGLPRRWRRSRRSACGSLSLLEVVWPQASTGMPRRGGGMYSVAASSGGGRSYSLWAGCTQRQKERWRAQRRECRAVSTGDRARTRRPSTPPARSPRGGTEPSHAKKSKDDPTTALSKDGHDTVHQQRNITRRRVARLALVTHSRALHSYAPRNNNTRRDSLYVVLAVAPRPRRGPRRTRAKVLEVLLHSWRAQTTAENIFRGSLGRRRRPRGDVKSP